MFDSCYYSKSASKIGSSVSPIWTAFFLNSGRFGRSLAGGLDAGLLLAGRIDAGLSLAGGIAAGSHWLAC